MLPTFISGNQDKIDYLSKALGFVLEHKKIDLDEIQSVDPRAVIEHKVRQAYGIIKKPILVEDVSLRFNALDGLPGPFVKFFVEAQDGLVNMCRMLDGFDDRSASGSVIYGYFDGNNLKYFEGRIEGSIVRGPKGDGGFGWDKIFAPDGYKGLTRAELSPEDYMVVYSKIRDIDSLRTYLREMKV